MNNNDKNDIYAIGTVGLYNGSKVMVVGHHFENVDNKYEMIYMVIRLPEGYLERRSIRLVNRDEFTLIKKGYSDDLFSIYRDYLAYIDDLTDELTADEIATYGDAIKNQERERGSNE